MQTAWRVVSPEHAEDAFSGLGASAHGGRWNSRGRLLVYTSATLALATLELMANIRRPHLLREYVQISCHFPEAIVDDLDVVQLPQEWQAYPAPAALQAIGDAWLLSQSSAVLKVPSVLIPTEFNYLLNPEHPHFTSIDVGDPRPHRLDYRLIT